FHGRQLQPRELTLLSRQGQQRPPGGTIFVTYPASEDVPQWILRNVFERNLDALLEWADEDEYLDDEVRARLRLPRLSEALAKLHRPRDPAEAEEGRRRLAFDELFFLQIVQARARRIALQARPGIRHERTSALVRPLHESLPFALTGAQARVLRDIASDMGSQHRMSRMLQGDVGSGTTLVALFAMLIAVEGGHQAAPMAPTEIHAEQHH